MFKRKTHTWYWYSFWMLSVCMFLFSVAKFFMNSIGKIHRKKEKKENRKNRHEFKLEELFI